MRKGIKINEVKKFEGCLSCSVSSIYGNEKYISCRSAKLGEIRYVHLKEGQKYPEWCPLKDKIIKREIRNLISN